MMYHKLRIFAAICCVVFSTAFTRAQTLEEIIEVTRQREASIRTAKITWSETRLMTVAKLQSNPGWVPGSTDVQSPPA